MTEQQQRQGHNPSMPSTPSELDALIIRLRMTTRFGPPSVPSDAVRDNGRANDEMLSRLLRDDRARLGGSPRRAGGPRRGAHYYARGPAPASASAASSADAFQLCDLGDVASQVARWRLRHPGVEPFVAVDGSNSDPDFVRAMAAIGAGFKCSTPGEVELVRRCASAVSPKPPDIIFSFRCKARSHVLQAASMGVRRVMFDSVADVAKCSSVSKDIELILRISTGAEDRMKQSTGAPRAKWRDLLAVARSRGVRVVGVSFNVGYFCRDPSKYEEALRDAREVSDIAEKEFGFTISTLDIGGGIKMDDVDGSLSAPRNMGVVTIVESEDEDEDAEGEGGNPEFQCSEYGGGMANFTENLCRVIDDYFPPSSGVRIIAEPGQYVVAGTSTLVRWWGMPKARRPASSLYQYVIEGFSGQEADERHRRLLKNLNGCSRLHTAAPQA